MRLKAPCKDCPRRKLGCHGQCREYGEYKAAMEAAQQRRQEANDMLDMDIRSAKRRKAAARRGGKRNLK